MSCVRLTGLREAYVAMDCLRGRPPTTCRPIPPTRGTYLLAYAVPYVWLVPQAIREHAART